VTKVTTVTKVTQPTRTVKRNLRDEILKLKKKCIDPIALIRRCPVTPSDIALRLAALVDNHWRAAAGKATLRDEDEGNWCLQHERGALCSYAGFEYS
jgi:hypothetical protein